MAVPQRRPLKFSDCYDWRNGEGFESTKKTDDSSPASYGWRASVLGLFLVVSVSINIYFMLGHGECSLNALDLHGGGSSWAQPAAWERDLITQEMGNWAPGRGLASTSSSSSASGANATSAHASSAAHHGPHQHDALLFLFNSVLIGTATIHINYYFPNMQVTVVLFTFGMVCSILLEGFDLYEKFGVLGDSYRMWLDIDPHLLLFTMLPTLLAGDAMCIDTQVAKSVAWQCLYMAGPGVILSSGIVACFLMGYLEWSFLLSLTTGSILCATDPVAVVALLKELGASPTLTVQIQGESLLNDGTAIVLYTVAYRMLSGEQYDAADIMVFLVQTAMMAVALGVFLGYVFFTWLRASCNRFNHHCDLIQILLTLSAAYWSFVLAEGVLKMSGVLATVSSSLILAHYMWPHIVSVHSMHNFWHTIETLGNILIFLLGGALCGSAMVKIPPINYMHLVVIYLFLLVVRGTFLFASRPILKLLSPDYTAVSWEDATVMTWGGLRGAVGLALAIQVNRGKAKNEDGIQQISSENAELVLFFVSGVAFLTTCVNATTAPALVHWLGITECPETQLKLMKKFNDQLVYQSTKDNNPEEVTQTLKLMLKHIEEHFSVAHKGDVHQSAVAAQEHTADTTPNTSVIEKYKAAEERFAEYSEKEKQFLGSLSPDMLKINEAPSGKKVTQECVEMLENYKTFDTEMSIVIDHAFLSLVKCGYHRLIRCGELRPGSNEANLLARSVHIAIGATHGDLMDYDHIHRYVASESQEEPEDSATVMGTKKKKNNKKSAFGDVQKPPSALGNFVQGKVFNISITMAILGCCLYVAVEEAMRKGDNEDSFVWLGIELIFVLFFTLEFVLKFAHMKMQYFKDPWNDFDFVLVVLGLVGAVVATVAHTSDTASGGGGENRFIRLSRVLRSMRFFRVFRLFHAKLSRDRDISRELDVQMSQIATYSCFALCQIRAQQDLMQYFEGTGIVDREDEVEIARCVIMSQTNVYNAWCEVIQLQNKLPEALLEMLHWLYGKKHIVEGLEKYVEKAQADGAISSKQAEAILHPLHEQISACLKTINDTTDGFVRPSLKQQIDTMQGVSMTGTLSKANREVDSLLQEREERDEDGAGSKIMVEASDSAGLEAIGEDEGANGEEGAGNAAPKKATKALAKKKFKSKAADAKSSAGEKGAQTLGKGSSQIMASGSQAQPESRSALGRKASNQDSSV